MLERIIESPVGPLTLHSDGRALTALRFGGRREGHPDGCPVLDLTQRELEAYFAGSRRTFTIPLAPAGTAFQLQVWAALREIPYGETVSYGAIAARIGNPKACRAVGMANNRNPISIIVPCHRVVGADGRLVGYGGGLAVKEFLLQLESGTR